MIESARTRLRRFTIADFENMRALESEPDIMKFTPSRVPQTPEQTRLKLQSLVEKEANLAPFGVWAAELKDTREFVGWFMLLKARYEEPELGFMIVKKHWGKGLATEISKALLDHGRQNLGVQNFIATTNLDNFASIKVLTKLGFKFSRTEKELNIYVL